MKIIKLVNNKGEVFVDDEDYEMLSSFNWCFVRGSKTNYAVTPKSGGRKAILMHCFIMGYHYNLDSEIDHKDRNGLNNQKSNLRYSTRSQNMANTIRAKTKNSYSRYKGVTFDKGKKRWYCSITKDYESAFSHSFDNEIDAAIAYDIKAKELFGEFALLNFINIPEYDRNRIISIINNVKKIKNVSSKFRGVSIRKDGYCFARLRYNGKTYYLGYFDTEEDAALAYNSKAIELLGDKAKLNIVHD